jgi:hypothetical protein
MVRSAVAREERFTELLPVRRKDEPAAYLNDVTRR